MFDGTIDVDKKYQKGAKFIINILKKIMRGINMNKILIVEDELMTAKAVKEALELNGMKAEIAENGIKGLDLIKKIFMI